MSEPVRMPAGLHLVRTTPEFTDTTTPVGLRRAHRVAAGVWGRARVLEGHLRFVFEDPPATIHELDVGDTVDIPPDTAHRVEPAAGCRFVVEFHSGFVITPAATVAELVALPVATLTPLSGMVRRHRRGPAWLR